MRYLLLSMLAMVVWGQRPDCEVPDGCRFLRHGMSVFVGFPVEDLVRDPRRGQRFQVVEALWGMEGAPGVVTVELSGGAASPLVFRAQAGQQPVVPQNYLLVVDRAEHDRFRQSGCLRAVYELAEAPVQQLLRERAEGKRTTLYGNAYIVKPWSGAGSVKIRLDGDDSSHFAETDAKGFFSFPELAPGRYRVVVENPGYENESDRKDIVVLPSGCGQLTLRLSPKSEVRGRLLYRDGKPGAKLPVTMMFLVPPRLPTPAKPERKLGSSAIPTHTLTDADGYFEFQKLQPGQYVLGTNLPGGVVRQAFGLPTTYYPGTFDLQEAEAIEIRQGKVEDLTYRMPELGPKRKLTVEVVREDGSPVAGAVVESRLHPRWGGSILTPPGRTDERGLVEFEIWPTTTYALYATRWDLDLMSFAKDDDNVVQKGEGPVRVRLVLQPRVRR